MKRILFGVPITLVVCVIIAITVFSNMYYQLTKEVIVATAIIKEAKLSGKEYQVLLLDENGNNLGKYKIYGDQIQLEVKFMKIRDCFNIFGINSRYDLDRLQGRYSNIQEQNTRKSFAYDLSKSTILNTFYFSWPSWLVDTTYGSSTYVNIQKNHVYDFIKRPTGIITRENKEKSLLLENVKMFFNL